MAVEDKDILKASADVQEYLSDLDVDIVGIVNIGDIKGSRLEEQALQLLPETNSIIVLGMEIFPEILNLTNPERIMGAASANTIMESQSNYISGKLTWVANDIARDCNICIAKCPAKALDYPGEGEVYKINKYACSTYLTEAGGCWECVKQCPVAREEFT